MPREEKKETREYEQWTKKRRIERQREEEKEEEEERLVAVTLSGTRPHRGAPWLPHTSLAPHHPRRWQHELQEDWREDGYERERKKGYERKRHAARIRRGGKTSVFVHSLLPNLMSEPRVGGARVGEYLKAC